MEKTAGSRTGTTGVALINEEDLKHLLVLGQISIICYRKHNTAKWLTLVEQGKR